MAEDVPHEEVDDLIDRLCAPGHADRRILRSLSELPPERIVPLLAARLTAADSARAFYRIAATLAAIGTDAAVETLSLYALNRRRFPRLAVNALAASRNPTAVPPLLQLLENGRIDQRRAAAFGLARTGSPLAVMPLATKASSGGRPNLQVAVNARPGARSQRPQDPIRREAWQALRRMGRTGRLAHKVLLEPSLSVPERLDAICALADAVAANNVFVTFDPRRYLEREAGSRSNPARNEARAAADLLRARETLLRPSEQGDRGTLLRAASGPGDAQPDVLLRGASAPNPESVEQDKAVGRRAWWQVLWLALWRRR